MTGTSIANLFDFKGKAALVTGGAVGIGQGIAKRLADAGAQVMISDVNGDQAEATAVRLREAGAAVAAVKADCGKIEEAEQSVAATLERFGRIDILVNNAGIYPFAPLLDIDAEQWRRVLDVNLSGAFWTAQAAARAMVDGGVQGVIVNIASIDGFHPTGNLAHYDASKGGMVMLTRAMALELGRRAIRVVGIAPGGIDVPAPIPKLRTGRPTARWRRRSRPSSSAFPSAAWASPTTSRPRRCSSPARWPAISPAQRWWWTAATFFPSYGRNGSARQHPEHS